MLDIKLIRENPEELKRKIKRKGADSELIDKVLKLDQERRESIIELEDAQKNLNLSSGEIAKLHGQQKIDAIKEAGELSSKVSELKPKLEKTTSEYNTLMLEIPNPPAPDVIDGICDKDNKANRKWGEPREFDFTPSDYLELAEKNDLLDLERAAKIAGSRSYYLKNELVLLEFAIVNYAYSLLVKEGFSPIIPPALVKRSVMVGGGYIPGGEDEIYKTQDETYLVGTSEQPLLGYHKDEIIDGGKLPLRYAGFSPCFRREAGSYGKDVKGILRVHQFDKIEMFSFVRPEDSEKEHEYLVSLEEKLMQGLEIPYQVLDICAGDLGAPASKKYDIEAWIPSEKTYRETHSCSNCTDFQSRRMNIRYKSKDGKTELVHTLNGTAFAMPRLLIAIMENYQNKDGSIDIPEMLRPYTGFSQIKKGK